MTPNIWQCIARWRFWLQMSTLNEFDKKQQQITVSFKLQMQESFSLIIVVTS